MNMPLIYRLLLGNLLFLLCWSFGIDSITSEDIEAALSRAREKVNKREALERDLVAKGNVLNPFEKLPEARHQLKDGNVPYKIDNSVGAILETATKDLVSRFGLSKDDIKKLSTIPLNGEIGRQVTRQCLDARETNCDPNSKYRSIDGRCNNLNRPNEGRIGSCHLRLAPNDYEDNISEPRTQGNTLPNAREISIELHRVRSGEDRQDPYLSVAFQGWGQTLTHDCLFTIQPQTVNNTLISCCPLNSNNNQECLPILLSNDPDFNSSCMNFVRNARCPQCTPGVREQTNLKTPMLDLSNIYGSTEDEAASLRSKNNDGKLASRIIDGVGEMPLENLGPSLIPCGDPPRYPCFLTGDFRANQNLQLLLNQICLFRLHNIIVDRLKALNGHWGGEKLYQEARRIAIAFYQHINIFEYVPQLIGEDMMKSFCLHYFNTQYDETESLVLLNEFAAAVFRFGHSTVPNKYLRITETGELHNIPLKDTFFNPKPMYKPRIIQDLARGSTRQCQQSLNRLLDRSVTQFLYMRQNGTPALDLAAINIQRGREHGLPGYTTYVRLIFKEEITSFRDLKLKGLIDSNIVDLLKSTYNSVHDIDLWVGVICERSIPGALLGRVSGYILAKQISMLKYGDRFFYTHQGQAGSFTFAQMNAISRITLARVFCDTFKLEEFAVSPFECGSPIYFCHDYGQIPPMDLAAWKEPRT